ncbi:MAG: nucleotidyl transferase [Planctomycetes bacterium]|nr:nucleotidyl transferase [Planctomycetota bacterium]
MHVRKAVITAAARGLRLYPAGDPVEKSSLPLLDQDGVVKPLLQIVAEEALRAGIEELAVICAPGDEPRYRERFAQRARSVREAFGDVEWAETQAQHLEELLARTRFLVQEEARGYGHAVLQARAFAGDEPFLLLLGDHLYLSHERERGCAAQLVQAAERAGRSLCAVQATREHLVPRYGTIRAEREATSGGLWRVRAVIEKPSLSRAELELQTNGLRAGHYLCFFGMHVLLPAIFEPLEEAARGNGEVGLSEALDRLAREQELYAHELAGVRCDVGGNLGYLRTQLALGLAGARRDEVLALLVETLASQAPHGGARA